MPTFPGVYANVASSTLSSNMLVTDSTLALQTGDGVKFPSHYPYPILVGSSSSTFERMLVLSKSTDTLTVLRGQQGGIPDQSYPQAWASGTGVYLQSHTEAGDYFGVGAIVSGTYAPTSLSASGIITLAGNTAQATGAAGTVATAGLLVSRVTPAAARTACVLAAGTVDGQVVIVQNVAIAANSITFDVAGTSNVADGASSVIAGLTSLMFVWNATTSLWYRVN